MPTANKHHFRLDVDVNVINHLGIGLYSSTPAALTELVANAWDADATKVTIQIDASGKSITIEDDGHGMNESGIKKKFLNVGYSRRRTSANSDRSDSGQRKVMGRKGIGKLAMFALSDLVEVTSQVQGQDAVAFEVNVPLLRASLEQHQSLELDEVEPVPLPAGHGTRINLKSVLKGLKTTEAYLRIKLARRFSVMDDSKGFEIFLNGKAITKADRGFYEHVQFLWAFDDLTKVAITKLAKNLANVDEFPDSDAPGNKVPCIQLLPNAVPCDGGTFHVSGYIASVLQPKNLGAKDDSANILSIFANGRVFSEDILSEANSAKYYQSYLVGEIHADFLDDDGVDRATASRESIKRDDPRYQALIVFCRKVLEDIGDQWDEWRTSLGIDKSDQGNAAVNEWLGSLVDKRDHRTAKKLMTSIKNAIIHPDDSKNDAAKRILYRGAITGFEKLRLKKQLDRLSEVSDVLSAEFASIFSSLNDVEEAAYADITRQRLEVIKKFKDIANSPTELEKVAQTYLFEHLWLLDPSWDRVTGRGEMEKTLTAYIKAIDPGSSGARVDITYRASSGRHIIVELKKPGLLSLNFDDLSAQTRKYKKATEEFYRQKEPNKAIPSLDIYLLIAKTPVGFSESDRRALAEQNGKIITYQQLITDASNAYQAYLDVTKITGGLEGILAKL